MRRAYAVLLLVAFSFPLMLLPLLSAQPDSKLPACCRRDGKHGCSMTSAKAGGQGSGMAIKSKKAPCPLFPSGSSTTAVAKLATPAPIHTWAIPISGFAVSVEQAEARYRVSFSRSSQKRGPPLS